MTIVPKKVKFKRPIDLNTISKESFLLAWDRDIYVFLMWERGITLNNELMFKNCRWMGGLNMLMMNVAVLFAESTLSLQLEVIFDFKMVTNSFGCRVLTVIWKHTKTKSPSETIVRGIKININLHKCQEIKELNYNLSWETESPNKFKIQQKKWSCHINDFCQIKAFGLLLLLNMPPENKRSRNAMV